MNNAKAILRFRTAIIQVTCSLSNWISDHVRYEDLEAPVGFRDYVRWWIEGRLGTLFAWAYIGSAEEVQDVIEYACDGREHKYLTSRQLEIRSRLCEWVDQEKGRMDWGGRTLNTPKSVSATSQFRGACFYRGLHFTRCIKLQCVNLPTCAAPTRIFSPRTPEKPWKRS
jgi:hypothetical protein